MNSTSKIFATIVLTLSGFTAIVPSAEAAPITNPGLATGPGTTHVIRTISAKPVPKPAPKTQTVPLAVAAMNSANTQKGARYVWGAEGGYSRGYDCSGLVYWSYRQHGKTLPRTTGGQYNYVHHIGWQYRKPGDLVFIRYGHSTPYHVGIYVGYWSGKAWMVNANWGNYRGHKVVVAPISEYIGGGVNAAYGRY